MPQDTDNTRRRLPPWLRRKIPRCGGNFTLQTLDELAMPTVCENAMCPNRMECFSQKTATFMILGQTCTRNCRFCAVGHGPPAPPAEDEPRRLASAAARLGLEHVVITSVTRDDLADGGAGQFARCIEAVRDTCGASVEVLTPDFNGSAEALSLVIDARPDVFNHNIETVPRLYGLARDARSDYRWTMEMFRRVRRLAPGVRVKTGLMLGLGETREELYDTLADALEAGCDLLTLGQYLQPTSDHLPVARYLPPDEFDDIGRHARQMGFTRVASAPFVRSSYHAGEMMGNP